MAVEGCGFTVDDEFWIAFGNHAAFMTLNGAGTRVALPGNAAIHDFAYVTAGYDLAAVTRRIADADDASHDIRPHSVKPWTG